MEISALLVAVGGACFGAAIVLLISRALVRFRPRRDREQVIRLEVRARTLHEHVHRRGKKDSPYTAEEVGDALFGNDEDDEDKENDRGRSSED